MDLLTADAVPDGDTTATGPARPAHPRRRLDPFVLLAGLLVLLPIIAAGISALRNPWIPVDDWALIELEVRAVGTGDTPLVGAVSMTGARHPGPLPFYALAVPYRLVPADRGLLFAAAFVNLAAAVGFVAVVSRHARSRAIVALAAFAVLQFGLDVDQLGDPWTATLPIVPFALYLVLCVDMATRPHVNWTLPVAVVVGSFVIQAHLTYAPPVALAAAVALGLRRWHRRAPADKGHASPEVRSARRGVPLRLLLPPALGLAAWSPPLIDQMWGDGNLGNLVLASVGRREVEGGGMSEDLLPTDRAITGVTWLLEPFGMWAGHLPSRQALLYPMLGASSPVMLLWLVIAFGGIAFALSRRRLEPDTRRNIAAVGLVAAAGVASTFVVLARVRGAEIAYDTVILWPFRWVAVVVMFVWIAVGWAATSLLSPRFPAIDGKSDRRTDQWRSGAIGSLLTAAVALPVVLTVWAGTLGRQPMEEVSGPFLRLRPEIERLVEQDSLVVANGSIRRAYVDLGLAVVLDRAGIPWVERDDPRAEEHWRYTVAPADDLEDGTVRLAIERGTAKVVARSGPPRSGEPADSELVLIRSSADARGIVTGDYRDV